MASSERIEAMHAWVQEYYESDKAFNFYKQIWGGEHLHVGTYSMLQGDDAKLEDVPRIAKASSISTDELLSRCFPSDGPASNTCTLMDLGSGFGGTARVAAMEYGCKVVCINMSKRENGENVALTKAAGLADKVIIPGERSFFATGMPDASCDVICSQDALLLAGFERYKAVAEAARALKPGGRLVFSDFMQAEGVDPKDMQEVYDRGQMGFLPTSKEYQQMGKDYGLECVEFVDNSDNVPLHYGLVRAVLLSRRGDLEGMDDQTMEEMVKGMDSWISAASRNLLCWGLLVFTKSG